jgi:hypothetical protein
VAPACRISNSVALPSIRQWQVLRRSAARCTRRSCFHFSISQRAHHPGRPADLDALQLLADGKEPDARIIAITDERIRQILTAAAAAAGLKKLSPHWLRHAHGSHAHQARRFGGHHSRHARARVAEHDRPLPQFSAHRRIESLSEILIVPEPSIVAAAPRLEHGCQDERPTPQQRGLEAIGPIVEGDDQSRNDGRPRKWPILQSIVVRRADRSAKHVSYNLDHPRFRRSASVSRRFFVESTCAATLVALTPSAAIANTNTIRSFTWSSPGDNVSIADSDGTLLCLFDSVTVSVQKKLSKAGRWIEAKQINGLVKTYGWFSNDVIVTISFLSLSGFCSLTCGRIQA